MLFPAFQPQTTGQIKKVTSSERSDSQLYRVTPRLMARSRRACPEHSRGNPEDILPMPFGAFQPPKPAYRILPRYPPDGHGYIFSCAVIIFHPQVCARSFELGIDGANEVKLLFASPAFELFFPSDGFAQVEDKLWTKGTASAVPHCA